LAFGKASLMPSSAPTVSTAARRLRAPIRGLLSGDDVKAFMAAHQNIDESNVSVVADSSVQRMLQDGAAQSEFGLEVGLQGINGVPITGGEDDSSGGSAIVVAVVILILLASGCGLGFCFCTKRRNRKQEEFVLNKRRRQHGDAASVGTYPSHRSLGSTSSDQYVNHRGSGRAVQFD
jgi:hypothetical protein